MQHLDARSSGEQSPDQLLRLYSQKNASYIRRIIFGIGLDAGFFSELNNMIFAMHYCIENQINFNLHSSNANFRIRTGWKDYFLPFTKEVNGKILDLIDYRYPECEMSRKRRVLRGLAYTIYNTNLLTSDIFYKVRKFTKLAPPEKHNHSSYSDSRFTLQSLSEIVWRFNPQTKNAINSLISELHLPQTFAGIHIRRGDKFIEAPLESVTRYMDILKERSNVGSVFVLTDDYKVITELKENYPKWTFYTFTEPNENGYDHKLYQSTTVTAKQASMVKLLASVELLRRANFFVGTYHSNPGKFLGMIKDPGTHAAVDSPVWFP